MFSTFIACALWTLVSILAVAGALHVIPKLGSPGRRFSGILTRAPGLDVLITYFTILPWFVASIAFGVVGFLGAFVGQILSVLIWTQLHELAHRKAVKGPRIVKVINGIVGPWRNHAALWCMVPAVPVFWSVRVVEYIVYHPLTWLVGLPPHNEGEWVNVSRQKFTGLVGHDLIWCLYCDWMTGIWALGSEMLRNLESFWCPIRFASDAKCENCAREFPDIRSKWIKADGTMAEVAALITSHYPPEEDQSDKGADGKGGNWRPWFGHPTRLTVEGQAPSTEGDEPTDSVEDEGHPSE